MAKRVAFFVFWLVQVSALLVFVVPFTWGLLALWTSRTSCARSD